MSETICTYLNYICDFASKHECLLSIILIPLRKLGAIFLKFIRRSYYNKLVKNSLSPNYTYEDVDNAKKYYIQTNHQSIPPSHYEEPIESTIVARENTQKFFLRKGFDISSGNKLFLILADSGMGKTTFLINLFIRYKLKYSVRRSPHDIFILPLSKESILEDIKNMQCNKGSSILLLDALDENISATADLNDFMCQLEKIVLDFKFVVITCRTQFFNDDSETPNKSSIPIFGPKKGFQQYQIMYLSPFDRSDIKQYLNKYFGYLISQYIPLAKKFKKRKVAEEIIDKCRNLMVRPMLLEHIDILSEKNNYQSISEIYKTLIDKWIEREVKIIIKESQKEVTSKNLYKFSNQIALNIYNNRHNRNGAFSVPYEEIGRILTECGIDSSGWKYSSRSLLNRDSGDKFKFSHKSFLEYFLAEEYFRNLKFNFSFDGFDVAKRFYRDMCRNYCKSLHGNKHISFPCQNHKNLPVILRTFCCPSINIENSLDIDIRLLTVIYPNFNEIYISKNVSYKKIIQIIGYIKGVSTLVIEDASSWTDYNCLLKIDIRRLEIKKGKHPSNRFVSSLQSKNTNMYYKHIYDELIVPSNDLVFDLDVYKRLRYTKYENYLKEYHMIHTNNLRNLRRLQ